MMLNKLYRRCFSHASPQPWLFVGLGNPGDKYKGTRHNAGFDMIDVFAESQGIPMDTVHCKAIFGKGFVDDVPVFLAKPQTYMNLSGESTGPLATYYKLPLNRVVVFHDDMDLPCGVLRLHDKGGHASHNGFVFYHQMHQDIVNDLKTYHVRLKSVIYHFRGNREFPRLRIGIGRPPGQMDPKAFLLQKCNTTARGRIDAALEEGVGALKQLMSKGLTETARSFNTVQKYKHIKVSNTPVVRRISILFELNAVLPLALSLCILFDHLCCILQILLNLSLSVYVWKGISSWYAWSFFCRKVLCCC